MTKEALEYSLIENLQRKDVDPLDIAKALKKLYDMRSAQPLDSSKRTHKEYTIRQFCEEISSTLGLSRQSVFNYLSLLNLTPEVQEMVSEDKLGVKLLSKM